MYITVSVVGYIAYGDSLLDSIIPSLQVCNFMKCFFNLKPSEINVRNHFSYNCHSFQ